jgi:hypothetical protein
VIALAWLVEAAVQRRKPAASLNREDHAGSSGEGPGDEQRPPIRSALRLPEDAARIGDARLQQLLSWGLVAHPREPARQGAATARRVDHEIGRDVPPLASSAGDAGARDGAVAVVREVVDARAVE